MPCYDGRDHYNWSDHERDSKQDRELIQALRDRCDYLTNLLCLVGRAVVNRKEVPKEVLDYWNTHRRLDEERGQPWTKTDDE